MILWPEHLGGRWEAWFPVEAGLTGGLAGVEGPVGPQEVRWRGLGLQKYCLEFRGQALGRRYRP